MSPTRRDFFTRSSTAVLIAGVGRQYFGRLPDFDVLPHAGDPLLKDLAAKALDAAKQAGAMYADIRFTLTHTEDISASGTAFWYTNRDDVHAAVGVRALVDGAWGFTAGPLWSTDEVTRLGREAAVQAKSNAIGGGRRVDIGSPPPAATGEWRTPILRDPFTISIAEKVDVAHTLNEEIERVDVPASVSGGWNFRHRRQDKTFASTDGSFLSQTLYWSHPSMVITAQGVGGIASRTFDLLQPAAVGWEGMTSATFARDIPRYVDEVVQMVDADPIQPNRYDIVFDAYAVARLMGYTIGAAAELDRVLGYEANAGGTSYLAPPEDALGKYGLGPPLLNVSADRSRPGGMATVQWDDEGVVPDAYTVIRDGVLVDYHTTRELVSMLAPWYVANGRVLHSHGCASSEHALGVAMAQPPNMALLPGHDDYTFDNLVAGLDDGLVVVGGTASPGPWSSPVTVDRQQLNGEVNGTMVYAVKKGKRVNFVKNAEVLFRAPEFWKSLQAIGGARSQVWSGMTIRKGQPVQELSFGTSAVPARFRKVAVTDRWRKA